MERTREELAGHDALAAMDRLADAMMQVMRYLGQSRTVAEAQTINRAVTAAAHLLDEGIDTAERLDQSKVKQRGRTGRLLSATERQAILGYIDLGWSNVDIAQRIPCSVKSVQGYRKKERIRRESQRTVSAISAE